MVPKNHIRKKGHQNYRTNMEGIPFYHHHLQPITPSQYNAYLVYLRSNPPL